MKFYLPVEVYEEKDCVKKYGKKMASYGNRALIVTGAGSSKKNGSLDDVTETLKKYKREYLIFDEIEENPSVETVMKARDAGVEARADFVIGVGGGSPMDAAKAIALMISNYDKGEEYMYNDEAGREPLPVVEIPTTCGTGSEVTSASVLTLHGKKTKQSINHKIFPKLALVDGKYIINAPHKVIRDTAVDALGHLIESFINTNATDYTRMFAMEGLNLWGKIKDKLAGETEFEYDMCQMMMHISTLAGMAIAHTGTSLPHALSYSVTYNLGMPHGEAVGYFLAGYLSETETKMRKTVLDAVGMKDAEDMYDFYIRLYGNKKIPEDLLEESMKKVLNNPTKLKNCPFKTDIEVLKRISAFHR